VSERSLADRKSNRTPPKSAFFLEHSLARSRAMRLIEANEEISNIIIIGANIAIERDFLV